MAEVDIGSHILLYMICKCFTFLFRRREVISLS